MNIIDDDAYCSQWCEQYLSNLIKKHNHGNEEAPFGLFATIIDAIYGDLISDDPFEPQEIHLSLTGKPLPCVPQRSNTRSGAPLTNTV